MSFEVVEVDSAKTLEDRLGEVQASPTTNTVLDRLKTLAEIEAAVRTALENIRDTSGIKKITEALPAGTNNIGDVDVVSLPATTQAGATVKTADFDTDVGDNDLVALQGIALPSAGGAVIGGTATNPLRVDPTGSTTQPVSHATASQADGHSATLGTTGDADSANTVIGRLKKMVALLGAGLPASLTGGGNLKAAIVEALPAGLNRLGLVRLADATDTLLSVAQGASLTGLQGILALAKDPSSLGVALKAAADGTLFTNTAISGIASATSIGNSSSTPLGVDGVFTGAWEDVRDYPEVVVGVKASHASAANGLKVEWSQDGSTAFDDDTFTIPADNGKFFSFPRESRYVRIVYTNGGTAQTSFKLQTLYNTTRGKASSHRVVDTIADDDDGELTIGVLKIKTPDGNYVTAKGDAEGNMLVIPTASEDFIQGYCVDGSDDPDLIANGSVTPVTYSFDAHPTLDITLAKIRIIMVATATNLDGTKFGSGAALTNGILISVISNGVETEIRNLQLNEHLLEFNDFLNVDQTGITDFISAGVLLTPVLKAGTGDMLKVVIRDNLTSATYGLKYLTCTVYGSFV